MIEDLETWLVDLCNESGDIEVRFTRDPTFFQWLFRIKPRTKVFVRSTRNAVLWFNKFDGSPAPPEDCTTCNLIYDLRLQ